MAKFGGWNINQNIRTPNLPIELQKLFDTATKELTGSKYEALEFLGSRVTKGADYRFLAYMGAQVVNSPSKIVIVNINVNLDGEVKVTKVIDTTED